MIALWNIVHVTLKLNPSRETVLPSALGKKNECDLTKTRLIVRYRATTTLRRPQKKHNTLRELREGGLKTYGNINQV